jgi:hypothetical protein
MKNIQRKPNNLALKLDQIWINQRHMHVRNYAMINDLTSNYFDYQ